LKLLSDTYRVLGDTERAAALAPAIERAERASRVGERVQRARALLASGKVAAAEAEVNAALALDARDPGALTTLGYVRLHQGRFDEAIATLRDVAQRDPAASNAHYGLAQVYAQTGNAAESERHLREFVRLVPRSYEAWRARERLAAAGGRRS
jgi:tetratricopeptide (TPR) repeat protein